MTNTAELITQALAMAGDFPQLDSDEDKLFRELAVALTEQAQEIEQLSWERDHAVVVAIENQGSLDRQRAEAAEARVRKGDELRDQYLASNVELTARVRELELASTGHIIRIQAAQTRNDELLEESAHLRERAEAAEAGLRELTEVAMTSLPNDAWKIIEPKIRHVRNLAGNSISNSTSNSTCIGRSIIAILAKEGAWHSPNGQGIVAADDLFHADPYERIEELENEINRLHNGPCKEPTL